MKTFNTICSTLFLIFLFCLLFNVAYSTSYTWNGATNHNWNTTTNWTPNGTPGSGDNVTLNSTGNSPTLQNNVTITNFTISSGTFDCNGDTITINGTSNFNGGTITNGLLYLRGTTTTFTAGTIDVPVDAVVTSLLFSGTTFNKKVIAESTSTTPGTGSGGSTFIDTLSVYRSSASSGNMTLANSSGNIYNKLVTLRNAGTGILQTTNGGRSKFNENIVLECSGTGGISLGTATGGDTLVSGKTFSVGSNGFSAGTLVLRNFVQVGSTAQSITLSSANLNMIGSTFNAAVTFSAATVLIKQNTFNSTASLTQSSSTTASSDGGNVFNAAASFYHLATSSGNRFILGNTLNDVFNSDVTFTSTSGGEIRIANGDTTSVSGHVTFSGSVSSGNNGGVLRFAGSNAQTFTASSSQVFNLLLDKSANNMTVSGTISIITSLNFSGGKIITTSTNLITMNHGSTTSGANNNSFVSGPIKKVGNASIVFPTGRGNSYRAIEISAPGATNDAFTAQYFDTTQTLGSSMDTTIDYISLCNYWSLVRNNGSSNVTVKLHYSSPCGILDSADLRVANWNGTKWKDLGNGGITGNFANGKVANSTTVVTYGYFTSAYKKTAIPSANAGRDTTINQGIYILQGSATTNAYWYPNAFLSCTNCLNPYDTLDRSMRYYLRAYDYKGRFALDSVNIFVIPDAVDLSSQMLPPAVEWRADDWAPINKFTNVEQTNDESGDEWWYAHENSYDDPVAQTGLNGYICAGYSSYINQYFDESSYGGCADLSIRTCWYCDDFEYDGFLRGNDYCTIAKKDKTGKKFEWFKVLSDGVFFKVIQTSDGGYLAVGISKATRKSFSGNDIYYNPISTPGTDKFDCGHSNTHFGNKAYAVKISADGSTILWENLYGLTDFSATTVQTDKTELYGVMEISNGYRMVGAANTPLVSDGRVHACYIDVDVDGNVIDRVFLPELSDHTSLSNPTFNFNDQTAVGAITRYNDGTDDNTIISGIGVNSLGNSIIFAIEFPENSTPTSSSLYQDGWNGSAFTAFNSSASQHLNNNIHNIIITKPVSGHDARLILPAITACGGCYGAGDNNFATGKLYFLDPDDLSILSTTYPPVNLGELQAYDLKIDAVATDDGGFGIISSKKDYNPFYEIGSGSTQGLGFPCTTSPCFITDHPSNHYDPETFYNSDAYVAKISAAGLKEWETTFDINDKESAFYPGDFKKQECMYTITIGEDGGFVVAGNNGNNFDNYYLAKLYSDCNSRTLYNTSSGGRIVPNETGDIHHLTNLVSNVETWTSISYNVLGSVHIRNGETLKISTGAHINFADSRKIAQQSTIVIGGGLQNTSINNQLITNIVVEPGGKLIVENGAELRSLVDCDDPGMWDGVQVWGNPAATQTSANQGWMVFKNTDSRIIDARIGSMIGKTSRNNDGDIKPTTQYGGGIFSMSDGAAFYNNLYSLRFAPYQNPNGQYNKSQITGSFFYSGPLNDLHYTDESTGTTPYLPTQKHIYMRGVRGIRISGNEFGFGSDPASSYLADIRGTGIEAYNSSFTATDNLFKYMTFGVNARQVMGLANLPVRIEADNTFNYNQFGAYIKGSALAVVDDNTFNIPYAEPPETKKTYGLWMDNSSGFTTTNNTFTGNAPNYNYGTIVTRSTTGGGLVALNDFETLDIGSQTERNNSALAMLCNSYTEQNHAWVICPQLPGSLADQGTGCPNLTVGTFTAGNLFNDDCLLTEQHIFSTVHFNYWANGTPPETDPDDACVSTLLLSGTRRLQHCTNSSDDENACVFAEPCTPPCNTERTTRSSETDSLSKQLLANFILQSMQADTLNNDSLLVKVLLEDNSKDAKKLLIPIYVFADSLVKARHYLDDSLALTNYEDSMYYAFYNILLTLAEDTLELEDMDAGQLTLMDSIANADVLVKANAQAVLEIIKGNNYDHDPEEISSLRMAHQPVKQHVSQSSIVLENFPNPFSEGTVIKFNAAEKNKSTQIIIEDLLGSRLKMYNVHVGETKVEITKGVLPTGIYLYSLWVDGAKLKSNKMIVLQ